MPIPARDASSSMRPSTRGACSTTLPGPAWTACAAGSASTTRAWRSSRTRPASTRAARGASGRSFPTSRPDRRCSRSTSTSIRPGRTARRFLRETPLATGPGAFTRHVALEGPARLKLKLAYPARRNGTGAGGGRRRAGRHHGERRPQPLSQRPARQHHLHGEVRARAGTRGRHVRPAGDPAPRDAARWRGAHADRRAPGGRGAGRLHTRGLRAAHGGGGGVERARGDRGGGNGAARRIQPQGSRHRAAGAVREARGRDPGTGGEGTAPGKRGRGDRWRGSRQACTRASAVAKRRRAKAGTRRSSSARR